MQKTLEKYRGIITGLIILVPMTGLFALCRYFAPGFSCTECVVPSILWFAGAECGMAAEAFLYAGRRGEKAHRDGLSGTACHRRGRSHLRRR